MSKTLKICNLSSDKPSMNKLLLLFFVVSCAHQVPVETRPSWVENIRNGSESLKVTHGSKVYYRRVAGSKDVSKQTSCNLVVMKAEEDLKKEFPLVPHIPYTVEVLFYDEEHLDCAVTISIPSAFQHDYTKTISTNNNLLERKREIASLDTVTENEASELVLIRSELASKFALTGLTKTEFEKFAKDSVNIINDQSMCSDVFRTSTYSIHGLTHVCWKGDIVAGYCTMKDKQCWTRTP